MANEENEEARDEREENAQVKEAARIELTTDLQRVMKAVHAAGYEVDFPKLEVVDKLTKVNTEDRGPLLINAAGAIYEKAYDLIDFSGALGFNVRVNHGQWPDAVQFNSVEVWARRKEDGTYDE